MRHPIRSIIRRRMTSRLPAALLVGFVTLAACTPRSAPQTGAEAAKTEPAGTGAVSAPSWVSAHLSVTQSGAAPVSLCHVEPAINEDLVLTILIEDNGKRQVGVGRVPADRAKPITDVKLQVEGHAPRTIPAGPLDAAAAALWPPGMAAMAGGSEAEAILGELAQGASVQISADGGRATRTLSTKDLAQTIASCADH